MLLIVLTYLILAVYLLNIAIVILKKAAKNAYYFVAVAMLILNVVLAFHYHPDLLNRITVILVSVYGFVFFSVIGIIIERIAAHIRCKRMPQASVQ